MEKLQRSWELLKSSLTVMGRNKELLLFPILTTCCTILVAILFLMPVAFRPTGYSYKSGEHWRQVANTFYAVSDSDTQDSGAAPDTRYHSRRYSAMRGIRPLAIGYFAVMYFASMFLATFFNVAFYKEIMNGLSGQPVSIANGLRFACTKWKAILMWTLFAGLVGYIIKTIEERSGFIGQMILKLLGTAWSIACVFVIPVMITQEESSNPLAILKQSALTLRRTWGESLIGYAGVGFAGTLFFLVSLPVLAAGIALSIVLQAYWFIVVIALTWLAAMFLWSYLLSVASQIFRCALFLYASQGTLPPPYTEGMMALAWKQKK